MHKIRRCCYIVFISTCYFQMMYKSAVLIYSDMSFLAKVPLIAFLHRMSVLITLFILVFCR